ncbi:nucleotidyl transferase AbiEii/AbiGii toxin family protein [Candidatus Poriferisodalis sp.]|uniref:nucleotidyl transferase AbiEii/AbiGii toxin family protein n=1 Tax=Candidatus Poriferisodalis sp. TaxID=3101277 RepID=UPI003B015E47
MSPQPSRDTTAGAAYLDLQAAARATGRPVDELFQLYALEGFLRRLVETDHAATFVLKGGVLLAAYTERRPTRDIDLAGTDIDGDLTAIASIVADIVNVNLDDGLDRLVIAKVEEIRDSASYPGIRATVTGQLDRARLRFHVDISIGDPLWPEPDLVELPQLLDAEPIAVRAYSAELILAEKIVTAIQRGTASTRWRDFVDIASLAKAQLDMTHLSASLQMVADHRQVSIRPLADVLDGYADLAQSRWSAWRNRQALHTTPEQFADLLDQVITFADPLLQPLTD